jgi:hypothetical protein
MEKRFVSPRKSSIFATEKSKSEKSANSKQQKSINQSPSPCVASFPTGG